MSELGRPHALSTTQIERAVVLLAAGVPQQEVSQMMGVSRQTMWKYLKSPEAQEQLELWRNTVKMTVLQRAAEGSVARTYDMLDRAAKDDNQKGVDASARAIHALEKASSSASGEARRIEHSGPEGTPLAVDVRALIGALVDDLRRDA